MRLRFRVRVAPLWMVLALAACEGRPPAPGPEQDLVEQSVLFLSIDAMDNVAGRLMGTVQGLEEGGRVEVLVDGASLGTAELQGDQWRVDWSPGEESRVLEVVATDDTGQQARASLELERLDVESTRSLYQPESLLILPTAEGAKTHYTLDGSTPTSESPVYTAPLVLLSQRGLPAPLSLIPTNPPTAPEVWRWQPPRGPVRRTSVVRFQQFQGTTPLGAAGARTFLVGPSHGPLPVLSLATDAEHFFGFERGIYVPGLIHEQNPDWTWSWGTGNYRQDGKDWERPVHVEWFEADGRPMLAQNAGVRIHGSGSAALPHKSLRLYAKEDYGPELFSAPVFPGSNLRDFKRLIVRTSGQDLLWSKIRDCALQRMLRETRLALQDCRPTVVYLNGEYWGLHELRERYDEYYISSHYPVDRKKVVILEGDGVLDVGSNGDELHYRELVDFVRDHDPAVPEHYAHVLTRMDVEDFIDYQVAQLYFSNNDWPDNNVKLWRHRVSFDASAPPGADGRWRWLLYDLDAALAGGPMEDSLRRVLTSGDLPERSVLLLRRLLRNPEFRERFVSRFLWHIEHTFAPARALAHLDAVAGEVGGEMATHVDRWGYPASESVWREHVQDMRDFFTRRPAFMRRFLREQLGPLP